MAKQKIFYAQSGGVTAVINATASGVIEAARRHQVEVYAGKNGIIGALQEELIDTGKESDATIGRLKELPGGAFGSCRYQLGDWEHNQTEYLRLFEVFDAHDIGYFLYNGGGDSQSTAHRVLLASKQLGYPLTVIGIPKTIDNDLPMTDTCPGFGSAAKYIATSVREIGCDLQSMAASSTKVFILEVMGRHAGWLAAAAGLAQERLSDSPHLILFPECLFDEERFLDQIKSNVQQHQHCVIVAAEGVSTPQGFLSASPELKDAFGHAKLGGLAPILAQLVREQLGYRNHWAVAGYMQRAARHLASRTDVEQAYALGVAAVERALAGVSDVMVTLVRLADEPYRWEVGEVDLSKVAGVEHKLPPEFIRSDGFGITEVARQYLTPLIAGELLPEFERGLPRLVRLENRLVDKRLPE